VTAEPVLDRARELALAYLATLPDRPVRAAGEAEALLGPLPAAGEDPVAVLNALAAGAEPGLVASAGPRYFGFVTGGALPIAVAAEWLSSAWDQNAGLHVMSPAAAAAEQAVAGWLRELLGLPASASAGFVTGAQTANLTALAAARHGVLERAGWDVERDGLQGAPRVRVL
jgi:glutamate/tyrosine decarboxylase-like PLP-dependent enzyme